MTSFVQLVESIGVFTAGMLARVGLFLAMVAVLVLPALALAAALRAVATRRERALGIFDVDGVPYRPGVAYAPGHLWLHARAGGRAFEVGLDGLAQRLVPGVSAVEVARPGSAVRKGETIATLHGGGRALAIPAPFDAVVAGVNAAALRDPAVVKRDGYGRGWLVALSPERPGACELRSGDAAESWLRREAARWNRHLEQRLGFAAADGGQLVAPAPWLVGEAGWAELSSAFLKP